MITHVLGRRQCLRAGSRFAFASDHRLARTLFADSGTGFSFWWWDPTPTPPATGYVPLAYRGVALAAYNFSPFRALPWGPQPWLCARYRRWWSQP